ncbi:DUF945 family protein [Aquabacterium lacunae]|uniref:DUF945 family protein n=1 Tax=Aquabacterium lacunae TaxID=2528630 RepID=A0A4Q9H4J8_9BURK|nr:DUF945 family protein [Aquabacterium lacunae]TBO32384.1 DUF945 family protein [Aquabacterium lacunae]
MKPVLRNGLMAIVGLSALAFGALPHFSSRAVDEHLRQLASTPDPKSDVLLRNLQHTAGYLSSTGSVDVVVRDRCHTGDGDADTVWRLDYEASHLPSFTASNRFHWSLKPQGEGAEVFKRVFGSDNPLQGDGQVRWTGAIHSDLSLPAMSYAAGGERLEGSPSKGKVSWHHKALQFQWQLDDVTLRGTGHAVQVKGLGIDLDLQHWQRGIGSMGLKVQEISSQTATATGLEFRSITLEKNDRLDSTLTQRLSRVQWAGQELKDMVLEASVQGLHAASVETLTTVMGSSCGVQALTREESQKVRQAVQTLLASGMKAGITRLSGLGTQGGLEGDFQLQLAAAAPGQALSTARLLNAQGKLLLKGELLNADQRQFVLASQMARETPDGLQATLKFEKGMLQVNGRPLDAAPVVAALGRFDEVVMAFLNDEAPITQAQAETDAQEAEEAAPAENDEAMAQAPAEPEAPAQAPMSPPPGAQPPLAVAPAQAPMAAAPPPADCNVLKDCMSMSLQAAMREDLDTVRTLAARMQALPKPAPGNRAQARKQNQLALTALQAGNSTEAVALLRMAVKEDPRDVEIMGNLGFALLKAQQAPEAAQVLTEALLLDPRRTATWAPLGEALGASGRGAQGAAALWIAWQWSGNRERTLTAFQDKAQREMAAQHAAMAEMYQRTAQWVSAGQRPDFKSLR